jgi:hypothetical protein
MNNVQANMAASIRREFERRDAAAQEAAGLRPASDSPGIAAWYEAQRKLANRIGHDKVIID